MSFHSFAFSLLVALGVGLVGPVAPASACSRPHAEYSVRPVVGPVLDVPLEGVIVLEGSYSVWRGADPVPPEVRVTTLDGTPIEGDVTRVSLDSYGSTSYGYAHIQVRELLVFRAAAPLAPESSYLVSVAPAPDGFAVQPEFSFEIVTRADAYPGLEPVSMHALPAARTSVSRDFLYSCSNETPTGGECPSCQFLDYVTVTALALELPAEHSDPYVIYELESDAPVIDREATLWTGSLAGPRVGRLYFAEPRESYCVRVVARSLVDGTTVESPAHCVDDATIVEPAPAPAPTPAPEPEPVSPAMSAGCSVSAASGGAAWLGLLLAFGVIRRRR